MDAVSTFQQLGADQSYALMQTGLSNLGDAVLASSINYIVDSFNAVKTAKIGSILGTKNIMALTITELGLIIAWR